MVRSRARGQAVVEFGLLSLLFTLLLFAIVDFGLLLNGWVTVSSAAREGARRAAVGASTEAVQKAAQDFAPVPGVSPGDVKVTIAYCPTTGACTYYCSYGVGQAPVTDPSGKCQATSPAPTSFAILPDRVEVTVTADQFEVVTPLVRPFFGCAGFQAHCFVPLNSGTSMRYEGQGLV